MHLIRTSLLTGLFCLLFFLPTAAQETILESYYAGEYEKVIQQTSKAIEAGDTAFNTFYLQALSEAQVGRTQDAIQTLEKATNLFPNDDRINKILAGQYYDAGNFIKAKNLYSIAVITDSSDVASWLKLAEIASFTQQYKEAIPILEHILVLDSTNLNGLMMLGDLFSRLDNSAAIVHYEKAYSLYPDNQKVAYALGNWYIQAKMPDKTVPVCQRVLEQDSTSIKFQKLLGYSYYKMGDPSPAIHHFKKAVALGDSSVFTFKFMGISQYLTSSFQAAIESLEVAVVKDTMDAENHFFLGASLGTTTLKEGAMYHLDQSLKLMEPDPAVTSRIFSEQGNIMRLEMKYEKAYELYSLAWDTDTTNLMSLYLMASILDNSMHLSKEALVDYQRYIDQVNRLPKADIKRSQTPSIRAIVEDRIVTLKEELFFLDQQ